MGKVAAGAGLLVRAIASQARWGHPLLFAIISYCGYAISAACLGVAVVLLMRSFPRSSARAVAKAGNRARSG
jgi:ABC-type Fe3+ transport system permease subunit